MAGFVPSNRKSRAQMLSDAGLPPPEQLFDSVPQDLRLDYPEGCPQLDGPLNEPDLIDRLRAMADRNLPAADHICFLGAGAYDHYQPAAIRHLLLRQEFYTSYTPYQPEVSQGTLQGIFEFQSLVCRMTDLDIANSSMYDGATAAAEALLMACRATGRNRIIVADTVHPHTREIIATICRPTAERLRFFAGRSGWILGRCVGQTAAGRTDGGRAGPKPQLLWTDRGPACHCRTGPSGRRAGHCQLRPAEFGRS